MKFGWSSMYEKHQKTNNDSYYAARMVKRSVPRYGQRTERGGADNGWNNDWWDENTGGWNDGRLVWRKQGQR